MYYTHTRVSQFAAALVTRIPRKFTDARFTVGMARGREKKDREEGEKERRGANFRRVHPFLLRNGRFRGRKQALLLRTAASATN